MGVTSYTGEFDPQQLTPTGIKPGALKPGASRSPRQSLLGLESAPARGRAHSVGARRGRGGRDQPDQSVHSRRARVEDGAARLWLVDEVKLEDMPPLPSLPGAKTPAHPLGVAEAALQAGDLGAAIDACEQVLAESGGLGGKVAQDPCRWSSRFTARCSAGRSACRRTGGPWAISSRARRSCSRASTAR